MYLVSLEGFEEILIIFIKSRAIVVILVKPRGSVDNFEKRTGNCVISNSGVDFCNFRKRCGISVIW